MRTTFINTLTELAEKNPQVIFMTGDLGYMVVEKYAERYPDRFLNVGVAEQNMVGIATGLAESGLIPFVYSIATFATLRPYEFIRNGPILHRLPVRIVGVGGGVEYGYNGPTHYGLEDLGVMRIQPGMTVIAPADYRQAKSALLATWDLPGPVYYRLGKDEKTIVPGLNGHFELGRAQIICEGKDLLFITTGSISTEVVKATAALEKHGIKCTVVVVSCFNPSPVEDLKAILSRFALAVTVEAHFINGGLGSLVAEVIAENKLGCRLVRSGVSRTPDGVTGSQHYMYSHYGFSDRAILETALREIGRES